jgi:leucyl aminopeptidase
MHPLFAARGDSARAIPIWFVSSKTSTAILDGLDTKARAFAQASGFDAKPGKHALLPNGDGKIAAVLFGIEDADEKNKDLFLPGRLSGLLPPGVYRFANEPHHARLAALAFALGAYRFDRYRKPQEPKVRLAVPDGVDGADVSRIADAVTLARDLINTPANDMGPAELEAAARALANRHGATFRSIIGDDLVTQNFPLVHAVGAGSVRAPRLIDITWGSERDPKVTLVGKGVCFDTGGLDIKPESAMLTMKKDMGGAATVLALAHMIMDRVLKVRLRVLIPAVENAVSGSAFRPLDVYRSRKGLSVEIGNTDAEGRLVLADALALADEETPDLLIDMGTLTGAARVALGPELPPFYTNDEALAHEVARYAETENDPVWRMPLWPSYDKMLDSKVADVNNVTSSSFAGSITCALFLKRFVEAAKTWLHFDIYAWVPSARSGRPEGGECQVARALYALLAARYG